MPPPPDRTAGHRRGGARRRARAAAVQALYQWHMTGQDAAEIEGQFLADRIADEAQPVDRGFFHDLLHGVVDRAERLDRRLEPLLDRPIARVDPVERAILRIGAFELVERAEIPTGGGDQRGGGARQDLRRRERPSLRERRARPAGPRRPARRGAPRAGPVRSGAAPRRSGGASGQGRAATTGRTDSRSARRAKGWFDRTVNAPVGNPSLHAEVEDVSPSVKRVFDREDLGAGDEGARTGSGAGGGAGTDAFVVRPGSPCLRRGQTPGRHRPTGW